MDELHELFNADGNDDILSDIGGGADIRNGMTAVTPNTVDEDGSSKFSTDSAVGQDEFPPQENLSEDLEYNHVGDATKDRFIMTEAEGIDYYLTRIIKHAVPREGDVNEQIDLAKRIAGEVLNDYFPAMENAFNNGDKAGFIKALKDIINYIRKEGFKYKEFVLINPVDALQQMFTVIGFLKEEDRDFHIKTIRQVLEELTRENLNERLQSYMPGSSAVSVKKKCRLGGMGNTSAACNQGDISNLDIKPIGESITTFEEGGILAFHGSPNKIDSFTDEFVGAEKATDQEGPGIYFTNDYDDAWMYGGHGGYMHTVRLSPRKLLDESSHRKVSPKELVNLIKMSPTWEDSATNWSENPEKGLYAAIDSFFKYSKNEKDLFQQVWYDFFRYYPKEFVRAMVGLGYDGQIIEKPNNRKHYIIYNPNIIEIIKAEKIGAEENGSLKEEVDASEGFSDEKTVDSMIAGDKNVGFINFGLTGGRMLRDRVKEAGFGIIPIQQTNHPASFEPVLVYRKGYENQANRLHDIMKTHGGYTADMTPEEGYEIGKLLDYTDESILKYLNRRYGVIELPQLAYAVNENGGVQEELTVNLPASSTGGGWNVHNIINDGEIVGEMELTDRKNQYLTLNKIIIHREFRGRGFADKAMRLLIDFADKNNKILTLTPDNVWGASKERLKKWYKSYGFVPNKGTHADYQTSESMYRLPKSLNEAVSTSLTDLPFKNDVEAVGGKIYSVGGAVRDEFLGKESKDLDILVTGIPFDELEKILSKYGVVNAVGKSFGILKFKPRGGEEVDVAIPRTETPTGEGGYHGFSVTSDHALPIEKDLERRDFTINSIAKDSEGNIVDPYGGREDLKNKIIRIVNPKAFSDDPLRMLRAVQFAARFGFTIEPETMKMIQTNAGRIKEIPAERVLIEFDKIVKKGNKRMGAQLLKNTGLFQNIFGFDIKQSTIDRSPFEDVKTMGEFIFLLIHLNPNPAGYYKNNLRGDINTYKEIKALDTAYNGSQESNPVKARAIAHNVYVLSPQTFQSTILPENIENAARELVQGKYPKTLGELTVNGNDLMTLGFKGSEIGDMLKSILLKIYADKLRNDKQELMKFAQQNKGVDVKRDIADIQEGVKSLNLDQFIDKYDQWNAGGRFHDPSKESVLRFLEDEFPDLVNDERLKNELRWMLTDREVLNEGVEERPPMKRVSYTGVILDKESRKQLLKVFKAMIPEGWEVVAHHMTIRLDELDPNSKEYLDMKGSKTITLNIVDYALNDLVMAVGVTGYPSESTKPHITLAINKEAGGKPAMSKELTDWKPLGFRFKVTGKIEEVENQLIETPQNTPRGVKRLAIFDFDGTLMNSPHPEVGKQEWTEKTGEKYPHIGWWSKPESLDLDIFDIKPFPGIYNQYQKEKSTPGTYVLILTSRIEKLRPQVEEILKRGGVHVDRLDMKNGDDDLDKGQKVLNYLKEFPDIQEINVYEDRDVELEAYNAIKNQIPENVRFNIYFADKGNLALTESKLLNTIKEEIQKLI
ncbi:MAG: GNAT family N-acetyltransferase [Dehalococcoidia bacterium]|jgi:tRNA nucleotidyltransferase/poly(A) polymerase/predicted GNAT family acetyltransferase